MKAMQSYFAACPRGLAPLIESELIALGIGRYSSSGSGVSFEATLSEVYQVILQSRIANSIFLPLAVGPVDGGESLYRLAASVDWISLFGSDVRLKVDFIGTNTGIRHTGYGAQRIKDAVVDQFQQHVGNRPNVDVRRPEIIIQGYLHKGQVNLSLNLSGPSLHKRGYRIEPVKAPLKENLAAAILMRSGWPDLFAENASFVDPMCGSGTFLIEAAQMSLGIAPGLLRAITFEQGVQETQFGFQRWLQHDVTLWQELVESAKAHRDQAIQNALSVLPTSGGSPRFLGLDASRQAVRAAQANIEAAGLQELIEVRCADFTEFAFVPPVTEPNDQVKAPGLLVTNPPYGERLGQAQALTPLYQQLGETLKGCFEGWSAAVFTGNESLAGAMRLRAKKKYRFMNGAIASQLWLIDIVNKEQLTLRVEKQGIISEQALCENSQMVLNRLKKNLKKLKRWRERSEISCYRLYDADIPEFACAIDVYDQHVHVQEYAPPHEIPKGVAAARVRQLLEATSCCLQIPVEAISLKVRRRQSGDAQYEKMESDKIEFKESTFQVMEGRAKLEVNLSRYLDTGLFLDHRPLRRMIFQTAEQKKFLNLFCYTATASVQAALGGATRTVSVDMSKTYLGWAKRNFLLNGLDTAEHQLINADCLVWLKQCSEQFDIIMLDPPSFSNSKKMSGTLDVQRDHVQLIFDASRCLNKTGVLYFSTNLRTFKMEEEVLSKHFSLENITDKTIDEDFSRNRRIHQCWEVKLKLK